MKRKRARTRLSGNVRAPVAGRIVTSLRASVMTRRNCSAGHGRILSKLDCFDSLLVEMIEAKRTAPRIKSW